MKSTAYFFNYVIVLLVAILSTSCSQDDDLIINPPSVEGEQQLRDTLTIGEDVVLSPQFSNIENSDFVWTVNGEEVAYDSVYEFIPESRGAHHIEVAVTNDGGEATITYNIHVWGAYENGFYMVNEGWFGRGSGTISFYRYDTGQLEDSIYVKNNPGKEIPVTSTLAWGSLYNQKLYLVAKVGGPLVVTDAYSMKEEQRIPSQPGNDWRAFLGVTQSEGLLSSSDGIYRINLETLQIIEKVPGITGQVGDMEKAGGYIFILSQSQGVVVLNATSYEIEKRIPGMVLGFAKTEDDHIWTAGGTSLIRINPVSLQTGVIDLGFEVYGSWGAWHPGSITAGTESVYIAKNGSFSGGKEIYRYDGTWSSLEEPFISLPESEILYGAGIGYNFNGDQLIVNTVREGWGENFSYNTLYFYDGQSGEVMNSREFTGYYFPATPVFH